MTAIAALVRWPLTEAPLYLDEAYSGLAARSILDVGLPFFPSGLYYDRDLIYHYALAGALELGGGDALAGRLLSFAAGLLLVPAVYALVRRVGGSTRWALLAAALVVIDPFTASMTPRMRMYPFLQLGGVWLLHAFWGDVYGPEAENRRWGARTAAAAAFSLAMHQLSIFFAPVLGAAWVVRAWRRRRVPWRAWLLLAVAVALPLLIASGVESLARNSPLWQGQVEWGGPAHTAAVYEQTESLSYVDTLRVKWQTAGPHRPASQARALLWLAAMIAASLAVYRRGFRVLVWYAWAPLLILILYPRHELPTRWLVHLAPLFAVLLAGGVEALADRARDRWTWAPWEWATVAVCLAGWAAAAVNDMGGPLWGTRYVSLGALLFWGGWGAARAWQVSPHTARWIAGAATALCVLIGTQMSMALWWTEGGAWAEQARALASEIAANDAIVVVGEDAPTVAWSVPRVDAVLPTWRLEYARATETHPPFEIATGAPVVSDVAGLEALRQRYPRIWFFRYGGPPDNLTADRLYYDRVQAPLVQWIDERAKPIIESDRGPNVWLLQPEATVMR